MPSFGGVGKEAITFLLTGDASDLIKTFDEVEKAADKSLGKAETSSEKLSSTLTKAGAASMAAGLATAAGLVAMTKDFEKAEAASNKFETAVKGMGSNIDVGRIKQLGFELQQVSGATDKQVIAAARWGAVFGLTTDQLEQLLRAAVDLSEQTGKSLDVTTKLLAKAASGEGYKGLTKLGLTFDETAYKADAFGTTISEATEFAGGAAAKHTDTMSGQLERLGHNFDNIKEQIGAGSNEVFEPLARGAANLSESLAKANPELLKTVGHFTAIGSMAVTGVGGLATFAGQFVNIKEAAEGLGLKLKDAEGGLSGLGKAAAGAGVALGVLAAADATFAVINEAKGYADDTARALDRITVAIDKGSGKDAFSAFKDAAKAQQDTARLSNIWESFGADIQIVGEDMVETFGDSVVSIENMQRAFDQLSPAQAKVVLDEMTKFTDTLDHNSDQFKTNTEWIKTNRDALKEKTAATDVVAKATGGLTEKEKENADALKDWDKALKDTGGALGLVDLGVQSSAAAMKGFSSAIDAMDTDELITSSLKLGEAHDLMKESLNKLPPAYSEATAALGLYDADQQKALENLVGWGDGVKEQITTLLQQGASTEEVVAKTKLYTTEMSNTMKQAGMTDDQINTYLTTLGLTPDQVNTAIILSGDEQAKWKLQLYHNDLVTLTEDQQTWIRAEIDQGRYNDAWRDLNTFKKGVDVPVRFQMVPGAQQGSPFVNRVGTMSASTAVVPMSTAVAPSPQMTTAPVPVPITINVTAGIGDPAEIGRKVIDAIRAAERVQGRGWRAA